MQSSFENIGMLAGAICFRLETYLSENQVFISVDLKYKERCLHVNRFQWLSSYMHNFVKKLLKIQNRYNMHTFSVGTNCLQNIKGLSQKL
jgi:hypothetical protein